MTDWPQGYGHLALGAVGSTLDEAARRFGDLAGPTWITATTQSAARGRRGRAWVSAPGNFAATLVLPLDDVQTAPLRSFVAALALHEALTVLAGPSATLTLKWPNDVLLNGGKLAGILLESLTAGGKIAGLAVGIGVNLAAAPSVGEVESGALRPVSLLGETGLAVNAGDFLAALAPAFARWEHQLATYGFAPIRTAWLAHAARLGTPITARLPQEEITGTFREVDEGGRLVLETPKGLRRIAAGDIFF